MANVIAGLIALIVPVIGIFLSRYMVGDMSSNMWTYIPLFWFPPFSLVPAVMIWNGTIAKK